MIPNPIEKAVLDCTCGSTGCPSACFPGFTRSATASEKTVRARYTRKMYDRLEYLKKQQARENRAVKRRQARASTRKNRK